MLNRSRLNNLLCNQRGGERGILNVNPWQERFHMPGIKIPYFEISEFVTGSHIVVNFNDTIIEYQGILGRSLSRTNTRIPIVPESGFKIDFEMLMKLPHEMLCGTISEDKSDMPLAILGGDPTWDHLTPDFVYKYPASAHVIEVKTTVNRIRQEACESALLHYRTPLLTKVQKDMRLFNYIVYANSNTIVTNLPQLTKQTKKVMITMVKLGQEIQRAAKSMGWRADLETSTRIEKIKETIRNLKYSDPLVRDPHLLKITPERMMDWKTDMNSQSNRFIKKSVDNMLDKGLGILHISKNSFQSVQEYVTEYNKNPQNVRTDKKTIVNMPFLNPPRTYNMYRAGINLAAECNPERHVQRQMNDDEYNTMFTVWESALDNQNYTDELVDSVTGYNHWLEETLESGGEVKAEDKRATNRVRLDVPEEVFERMATVGVHGKQYKKLTAKIDKREHQQRGFRLDADVSDLDSAFAKPLFFYRGIEDQRLHEYNERYPVQYDLIKESASSNRCNEKACQVIGDYEVFFRSPIGRHCMLMHEIATEINISMKQNCKKGTFVLKELTSMGGMLLIKPGGTSGRSHFSILFESEELTREKEEICYTGLFKKPLKFGKYSCTTLVSYSKHDITHFLNAHIKMANIYFMWCQIFSMDIGTGISRFPIERDELSKMKSMLNCNLLSFFMYSEHRRQSSTHFQHVRYFYMESLRPLNSGSNPLKILKKFDPVIRSRLIIWLYSRLKAITPALLKKPPTVSKMSRESDELTLGEQVSFDSMENLISFIDGSHIPTFEAAVNISYIGYLHNKDTGEEVQSYFQIFEKVILQEREMDFARPEYMGYEDNPDINDIRTHEFNKTMMMTAGDLIRDQLMKNTSESVYDEWFLEQVADLLAKKDLLSYATTKTSAYDIEERSDVNLMNRRRKCLEMAISMLDADETKSDIVDCYQDIMDEVTERGLRVNLFKKNQIGSTREIFVLEFKARILLSLIETIARAIGIHLPMEMISKGDQKMIRNDEHVIRINEEKNKTRTESYTVTNSADAKTWCQRFVMPCFGVLLSRIVPKELFPLVSVCLNAVTFKKLELPADLLTKFTQYAEETSFRPGINLLKENYQSGGNLLEANSCLMNNRSNMMQGILHEVSSVAHAGILMVAERINERMFACWKKTFKYSDEDVRLITSYRCSSDDSALLSTIVFDPKLEISRGRLHVVSQYICATATELYKQTCMENSEEKSTQCVEAMVMEFNSYWSLLNTIITPMIKFVFVSFDIPCVSRVEARQFHLHAALSQNLENGASLDLLAHIHVGQAMSYYNSLGAGVIKAFDIYARRLHKFQHPNVGFFCLQPLEMCGVLGYDYALYNHCRSNIWTQRLQHSQFLDDNAFLSMDGKPLSRVALNFSISKNYRRFLKRTGVSDDEVERCFINDPKSVYMGDQTREVVHARLSMKCLNPDISSSFSFDTTSKLFAASVYMLQTKCITFRLKGEDGEITTDKMTYFESTKRLVERCKQCPSWGDIEWGFHFPNIKEFDFMNQVLAKLRNCHLTATITPRRRLFHSLPIMKGSGINARPLISIAKWKWFEQTIPISDTVANDTWLGYCKIYPWLKETYEDTINDPECPFKSHQLMYTFMQSTGSELTSIRYLAPIRKGVSVVDTLVKLVFQYQWPSRVVLPTSGQALPYSSPGEFEVIYPEPDPIWANEPLSDDEVEEEEEEDDEFLGTGIPVTGTPTPANLPTNRHTQIKDISDRIWRLGILNHTLNNCTYHIEDKLRTIRRLIPRTEIASFLSDQSDKQLAVLAHAMNAKKESEFCSLLEHSKHGLAYRYDERQTWDEDRGMWVGPLSISGTVDGMIFRMVGRDHIVKLIEVSSFGAMKQVMRTRKLSALVRSLRLINEDLENYDRYLNIRRCTISQVKTSSDCIPLSQNRSLRYHTFEPLVDRDIKPILDINSYQLRVRIDRRTEHTRTGISYPSLTWTLRPFSSKVVYNEGEAVQTVREVAPGSKPYKYFVLHQLKDLELETRFVFNMWRRENVGEQLTDAEHEDVMDALHGRLISRGKLPIHFTRDIVEEANTDIDQAQATNEQRMLVDDNTRTFLDAFARGTDIAEQMNASEGVNMFGYLEDLRTQLAQRATIRANTEPRDPIVDEQPVGNESATIDLLETTEINEMMLESEVLNHASLFTPEDAILKRIRDNNYRSTVFDTFISDFENSLPGFFLNFMRAEADEDAPDYMVNETSLGNVSIAPYLRHLGVLVPGDTAFHEGELGDL